MRSVGSLLLALFVTPPCGAVSLGPSSAAASASQQSQQALRLRSMLEAVCVGDAALALVTDPRERTLLRGVRAAAAEPEVVEAFTILYEDIAPIRIAGDLIFRPLERRVRAAHASEVEIRSSSKLAYQPEELAAARRLFDLVDADGSGTIDREELLASGLLSRCGASDVPVDQLLAEVDQDGDAQISFIEFVLASSRLLFLDNADGGCGVATHLAEAEECVLRERDGGAGTAAAEGGGAQAPVAAAPAAPAPAAAAAAAAAARLRARRRSPSDRFSEMLLRVEGWSEELDARHAAAAEAAAAPSRIERVLRGSIVGGRNEEVVAALRLCYTDYKPLRLMGDLIFSLMGKLMRKSGPS